MLSDESVDIPICLLPFLLISIVLIVIRESHLNNAFSQIYLQIILLFYLFLQIFNEICKLLVEVPFRKRRNLQREGIQENLLFLKVIFLLFLC